MYPTPQNPDSHPTYLLYSFYQAAKTRKLPIANLAKRISLTGSDRVAEASRTWVLKKRGNSLDREEHPWTKKRMQQVQQRGPHHAAFDCTLTMS